MGVRLLMKFIQYATKRSNSIRYCRGKRVGVDGFVWLHEAVVKYAREVVICKDHSSVLRWIVFRCQQWLMGNIMHIIVFDGKLSPNKADTKQKRVQK
jgi:exonuclease-1